MISLITWMGRVTLWLLFWPLGLWRSIVHSNRKHTTPPTTKG